jgi:hypothetical protein
MNKLLLSNKLSIVTNRTILFYIKALEHTLVSAIVHMTVVALLARPPEVVVAFWGPFYL